MPQTHTFSFFIFLCMYMHFFLYICIYLYICISIIFLTFTTWPIPMAFCHARRILGWTTRHCQRSIALAKVFERKRERTKKKKGTKRKTDSNVKKEERTSGVEYSWDHTKGHFEGLLTLLFYLIYTHIRISICVRKDEKKIIFISFHFHRD